MNLQGVNIIIAFCFNTNLLLCNFAARFISRDQNSTILTEIKDYGQKRTIRKIIVATLMIFTCSYRLFLTFSSNCFFVPMKQDPISAFLFSFEFFWKFFHDLINPLKLKFQSQSPSLPIYLRSTDIKMRNSLRLKTPAKLSYSMSKYPGFEILT